LLVPDFFGGTMKSYPSPEEIETVLHPEMVSKRRLPVNLKQDDLELFSREIERVIPQTRLLEIRNTCVSSDGLLFRAAKILPESFAFPSNMRDWRTRSVLKFFVVNYLFRSHRRYERHRLWVTDDWSSGYFHWLTDVLTRLFTIKDRLPDMVLLLPGKYEELDFVRSSLKPFPLRGVEFIAQSEVLFCEKLMLPTHTAPSGNYNEELIRGVRNLLVGFYSDRVSSSLSDRIYISRGRARKRKIKNEEEVIEILREFDFKTVYAEDCSFEQQVKIAANATYLVSNHGAGLSNMLFMNPGSSVLEMRNKADRVNNCYFTLASALGLNYFYQACESERPGEEAHTANLWVDVRQLRDNIQQMIDYKKVSWPSGGGPS